MQCLQSESEDTGGSVKDIVVTDSKEMQLMAKKLGVSLFIVGGKELRLGQGNEKARHYLENRQYDGVYDLEVHGGREFMHHRNSGLNQVLCKIACDKKKIIIFDIGSLLSSSGQKRALIIGRMRQNVRLCRKYKVTMALASFAHDEFGLRRPQEMVSIGQLIGMTYAEAKAAAIAVEKRLAK